MIGFYEYPEYGIVLKTDDKAYEPAEDSYLVIDNLILPDRAKYVYEIGAGTGIISIALAKKFPHKRFVASDISYYATRLVYENVIANDLKNVDVVCTDRITSFFDSYIDILIWNPPYLPVDGGSKFMKKYQQLMFFGGKRGYEAVEELLFELQKSQNKIEFYTIFSSLGWKESMLLKYQSRGICSEIIAEKSMFFEKIFLVKLIFNCDRQNSGD